jgi:hypothetical protein
MVVYVEMDCVCNAYLYKAPAWPAVWSIGSINQRVEIIMHLSMNTQKSFLRLILQWAGSQKYLQPLIELVQSL